MYLGEQIINPSDDRLRLSAQLGVESIIIDTRPNVQLQDENGRWDPKKVRQMREWVGTHDLDLEVIAMDVGSILLDSIYNLDRAKQTAENLRKDIRAAAEGGLKTIKYNLQMVGITRTGLRTGRGGVKCSTFCAAEYKPENDALFSYWGVGHPGGGVKGADVHVNQLGVPEACGQVHAKDTQGVTEAQGWQALEFLVENIAPTAQECGIRLAAHPHDPAFPIGGLNGVNHVVGSLDGMRRFINLDRANPYHGFNFCQGTIAEMSTEPTQIVLDAIREFGAMKRIFMVHFRNIKGGYLDFCEAFPDEGSVDMAECIKAYREVGYDGPLCPDHVPVSDLDPARERFFAFSLGYTRGLIHGTK